MTDGNGRNGAPAQAGMASVGEPSAQDPSANADKTISAVLGEIVWLMSQSAEFKQYLVADL